MSEPGVPHDRADCSGPPAFFCRPPNHFTTAAFSTVEPGEGDATNVKGSRSLHSMESSRWHWRAACEPRSTKFFPRRSPRGWRGRRADWARTATRLSKGGAMGQAHPRRTVLIVEDD